MASVHTVNVKLLPGVQSIRVVYKPSLDSPQWIDYNSGQKLPQGVIVKFYFELYNNFNFESATAYYADEYDDTVDLQLTGTQGEQSRYFTMPNAEVFIRIEASGSGSSSQLPPYQNSGSFAYTTNACSFDVAISEFENLGYTISSDIQIDLKYFWDKYVEQMSMSNRYAPLLVGLVGGLASGKRHYYIGVLRVLYSTDTLGATVNCNSAYEGAYRSVWETAQSLPDGTPFPTSITSSQFVRKNAAWQFEDIVTAVGAIVTTRASQTIASPYVYGLLGSYQPTPDDIASIRYILSPSDSGEIDASAPSELTGESSFTFKYRIKANYVFKRLTPFALNNVYYESEIVYAIDSYDGETRTYTFTVSQIPEGATGVNVVIESIRTDDPNDADGTNASDSSIGGDGTFDDESDHISLPSMPSGISAADSGLVTLFRPSIAQVKDFGDYLWSNLTEFIENLQKLFTSPMDYVIAFNVLPVSPSVGVDKKIYIGNWLSTIEMPPVLNQFYEFNAGTIQIKEYFGSFLDYAPNSRARIMLPFIGDRDLAVNEIMDKTLQLWYRIDLLSGACVAILNINDEPFYQWSGNCAVAIPVTSSDWSRLYGAIARVATIGAGFAFLGAGGAMTTSVATSTTSGAMQGKAIGEMARAFNNVPKGVSGVARERSMLLSGMENIGAPETKTITSNTSRAISGTHLGAILGHNMMGAVPRIQHTGDMSGAISIMGNRTPYIVLEYPNVNLPDNYKHIYGYPSNQYAVLGNLSGFTKCKEVLFESGSATDDEIEMVVNALKGGVYL